MKVYRLLALIMAIVLMCCCTAFAEDAAETETENITVTVEALPGWNASTLIVLMQANGETWMADADFRSLFTAMYILETYGLEGVMSADTLSTFGIPEIYLYFADAEHDEIGIEMYFTNPLDSTPACSIKGVYKMSMGQFTAGTYEGLYDPAAHLDNMVTEGKITEYFIVTPEELQNGMSVLQMLLYGTEDTVE